MLRRMNTILATMDRPFDAESAEKVVNKASDFMSQLSKDLQKDPEEMPESETLSLVLKVRAPEDKFSMVMDDCWARVALLASTLDLAPISADTSYMDQSQGTIHLVVPANLALALAQEQDYFHCVALDTNRWR